MKSQICILMIIFGQAMLAQKLNGFYFEPLINVKTTVFTKKELPATLTTQNFEIKPQNFITPIGFNLGLNIGYNFKNEDKFQIGFSQDEAISGIIFTGTAISDITSKKSYRYPYRSTDFNGVSATSLNLLYKKKLLHIKFNSKKESIFKLFFNIGLSYLYKPNNGLETLTGTEVQSFYSSDSSKITLENTTWVFPLPFKYSFKFNCGIDLNFGKNDKEWFSLNVSYISNLSQSNYYSFMSSTIYVENKSKKDVYVYYVKARGNGIYYQISRRFYPFKWYNNRQQKKLEEYKAKHKNM